MGNHNSSSHHDNEHGGVGKQQQQLGSTKDATMSMTRSPSGADINEKNFTQYVPIERLSKVRNDKKMQTEYDVSVHVVFVGSIYDWSLCISKLLRNKAFSA